ncbi:uncharacterized protein [Procambarus clarkii]|uniref:uncharacterized protein isoform X3 n=1 Tax=Procambarus clarkii TaxID=6728 RepID=UPI0037446DEC
MFMTPGNLQVSAGVGGTACTLVKVYVRTRPLLQQELENGAKNILDIYPSDKQVVVDGADKIFQYDDVFQDSCSQDEVYRTAVAPLVAKVESGHNATVFAYGQTGSGKTFTMGTNPCIAKEGEGILQRAMQALLGKDENHQPSQDMGTEGSRSLKISMMEVYNEAIFDLLGPTRVSLETKPATDGGMSAVGMVEKEIKSIEEGLIFLEKGNKLRSVGSTAMNQHSSRSHAVIYLTLKNGKHCGCLKLVDLAGAEGVGRAQTSGQKFTEGVNINKGLLTLGKVLSALSSITVVHVPYRDSILTRLLKDSLSGNCQTAMIACVNPADFNKYETTNTLRYAEHAKNIRLKPQALSTVKRHGVKRRCDETFATPLVRKKGTMPLVSHNSTISTPGHKPTARPLLPSLNVTIATPSGGKSEVLNNRKVKHQMPPPASIFSSITQPIFEDCSPSRLSTVSAIDNPDARPSEICSSIECERHLDSPEDCQCAAKKFFSRHARKKKSRHPRKKKVCSKSRSSTPTNDSISSDSSDDILGTTIVKAFTRNHEMKRMLQDIISSAFKTFNQDGQLRRSLRRSGLSGTEPKASVEDEEKPVRKPLEEVTNLQNRRKISSSKEGNFSSFTNNKTFAQNVNQEAQRATDLVYNLPLTSTAFIDDRTVRRSTRLSTKINIHKSLFKEDLSEISSNTGSPFLMGNGGKNETFYKDTAYNFSQDTTVVLHNGCSPELMPRRSSVLPQLQDDTINKSCTIGNTICSGVDHNRSLLPQWLSENHSQTLQSQCRSQLSPLQKSRILRPNEDKQRRRSSRVAALRATQRNFELLKGERPLSNLSKKRRSSLAVAKNQPELISGNQSVCGVSRNATYIANDTKWQPIVSPNHQKQHNDKILNILNSGDLRKLQQLPLVGPKSAMVLRNFREIYGCLSSIEDIEKVPGLPNSFCKRFIANGRWLEQVK